jgi:outer membrane receptor protein involved in Fe transport
MLIAFLEGDYSNRFWLKPLIISIKQLYSNIMKSFSHKNFLISVPKLKTLVLTALIWPLFAFTSNGSNPGKIEGLVSDAESHATIPAVKVELLNAADSSVIRTVLTNNDGRYLIDDVPFGKYVLRISGITYQKQIVSNVDITTEKPSIKFGTTNLLPQSKLLKEVGVFGYKLTGQMEDNKTIYTIKPKSSDIAQSGLDLLRQLPDVDIDFRTNEVTLAGNNNIIFQVNGKKVDRSYLMQLNPKLIEKVEVITNPGVKYDADVDAVINLILKKNIGFGLSGKTNVEIPTSKTYFSNNSISFDYFTKGLQFFVSGRIGIQDWDLEFTRERYNSPSSGSTTFTQHNTGSNKIMYGGFNYGVDWFINDNNIINVYSTLNPRMPNKDDFASDNYFTTSKEVTHTKATSIKKDNNFFNDYSLFYKHKFAKKNHEFSFESYYSSNANYSDGEDYEQLYSPNNLLSIDFINKRNQNTNNKKWQLTLKADYTCPLTDKLKLSAGYNSNFNRISNSYTLNVTEFFDKINYDEDRHSAYSNIALNTSNFDLQSGVRFESSFLHILHTTTSNGDYHCFLPFTSVQYKLGKKQTFRLNYRKSINRPGMSQISPFGYRDDSYTLQLGNPDLSPAYINKFEFTHRIQLKGPMYVSYQPYISFTNNGIRQINLPMFDSISQKKFINVSEEIEYGAVLSSTLAFVKWWSISPSYTFYQREIKAFPQYSIDYQKRTAWRLGMSSQFILPKEWVVFVDYRYTSPVIAQQRKTERNYQLVTGFYKSFTNKFKITVFTLNLGENHFTFYKNTTTTETMREYSSGVVKYNWIINIRLSYTFNKGKEGKKVDRQIETDSDTGGNRGIL